MITFGMLLSECMHFEPNEQQSVKEENVSPKIDVGTLPQEDKKQPEIQRLPSPFYSVIGSTF